MMPCLRQRGNSKGMADSWIWLKGNKADDAPYKQWDEVMISSQVMAVDTQAL